MNDGSRNLMLAALASIAMGCGLMLPLGGPPLASTPDADADLSCDIPRDVVLDPQDRGRPCQEPPRQVEQPFYRFAWKTFIALICSADTHAGRGIPAKPLSFSHKPLVFETYKSAWEIFPSAKRYPPGHALPRLAGKDEYGGKDFNPCGRAGSPDEMTLGSISQFTDINQGGIGSTDIRSPIVAQNATYVHYLTQFNETAFSEIASKQLYLADNTQRGVEFPAGSIFLKSAWIETHGLPPQAIDRYYHRTARVQSPIDGNCEDVEVALVALHIVQKTPTRPQRIWATFEHEDNVPYCPSNHSCPAPPPPPPTGYRFYKPGEAIPNDNPFDGHLQRHPAPFNIERKQRISPTVETVNTRYAADLGKELPAGSPWTHYRLVMAQWPVQPSCPSSTKFFTTGPWTWANPVVETYFQEDYKTGTCMACHQLSASDFVWSLQIDAYSQGVARNKALSAVRGIFAEQVQYRQDHAH